MDNNRFALFSAETKLADVILENYTLLTVLPRFDIELGFGDRTLSEVCQIHGVDRNLFLLVCNIHTFDGYVPSSKELESLSIEGIVKYLKSSHEYYTIKRIARIESKLYDMLSSCQEQHRQLIDKFFKEYKNEVTRHFSFEESVLFPFMCNMVKGEKIADFDITNYEDNHGEIDDKLSDLKNIIIKYLPVGSSSTMRNDILIDIFTFEDDMKRHIRIEDMVLVPFVKQMINE